MEKKEVARMEFPLDLSILTLIESKAGVAELVNSKIFVSVASQIIRLLRFRFPSIENLVRSKWFVQTHTDHVLKGVDSVVIFLPRDYDSIQPPIVSLMDPKDLVVTRSVEVPSEYPYCGGCCHGVVCLYNAFSAAYLLNPLSLAFLIVEPPPIDNPNIPVDAAVYTGFDNPNHLLVDTAVYIGFDKSTMKFKLVCIQVIKEKPWNRKFFWHIKTVSNNNEDWRCVSTRPLRSLTKRPFGYWDGCLYLIDEDNDNIVIVSVDLQTEVITELGPFETERSLADLGEDDRVPVVGRSRILNSKEFVESWALGNNGSKIQKMMGFYASDRLWPYQFPVCWLGRCLLVRDQLENQLIKYEIGADGSAVSVARRLLHEEFYCFPFYDTLVSKERIVEDFFE